MLGKSPPAAPLALTLLTLGCDLPPIEYETEHLKIGTDSAEPLCAGTLHELDSQVRVVEDLLDFQVEDKLEVYLFEDDLTEWCPDGVRGCYDSSKKRAYTSLEAARHEIVHAAAHQNFGFGDALFDEGLAIDLTGQGLKFARTFPASNLGLRSIEISPETAGHFMRWLRSRYTPSEIKLIVTHSRRKHSADHALNAFHKATGDEFTDIENVYLEVAPEFYAPFDIVAPAIATPVGDGWDIVVSFDCSHPDTRGFGGKMWQPVRIEVTEPGPYIFVVTPPATATITRHHTQDIQVGEPTPTEPPWPIGDDWFDDWLEEPETLISDWPTEILHLEAGIYDIEIQTPGTEPTTAAVGLHPKIGNIPTAL